MVVKVAFFKLGKQGGLPEKWHLWKDSEEKALHFIISFIQFFSPYSSVCFYSLLISFVS